EKARRVEGVEAIGAVRGHSLNGGRGEPVENIFLHGVELVVAPYGRTHRVEHVAVLAVAAGSDNAVAGGRPGIRVPEAVVVAPFMDGHARTGALQPRAFALDIAQTRPVEARHAVVADD